MVLCYQILDNSLLNLILSLPIYNSHNLRHCCYTIKFYLSLNDSEQITTIGLLLLKLHTLELWKYLCNRGNLGQKLCQGLGITEDMYT